MPPERRAEESISLKSSRFGDITVPAEHVIHMPNGMIGFSHLRRYVLVRHREDSPFHWLQALDEPSLAFAVVTPLLFDPKYQITLGKAETSLLKLDDPNDIQSWAVITIPQGEPQKMTANLKAPVVINLKNRLAAQVVLDDPRYPLRKSLPK